MIDQIHYPEFTDKCRALIEWNQYTFDVDTSLTKPEIKQFIEYYFNVNVVSVNTHLPPRKKSRVGGFVTHKAKKKRAIVSVRNTQTIKLNV
jgi:large subunit ribosomal protein L23